MGLYHTERYGKPSLVLDLVEELRIPIIDSTIFPLFLIKQMEKAENFEPIQSGVYRLSNEGKRKIVQAVYNRFNEQVFWDGKRREVKVLIRHQMQCLVQHFLGKRCGRGIFGQGRPVITNPPVCMVITWDSCAKFTV